jgi:hypothetical protein
MEQERGDGGAIVAMSFRGLEEVSPGVRPTTGMDHLRGWGC